MRRKPNLASRIEKCAHFLVSNPCTLRGNWLAMYPHRQLYIEIGCGKGRFTTQTAKATPEALIIGIEKTANVLVIALERAEQDSLANVLFINDLADDLDSFFAPGEVSRIYLNFSDPWPSNRHAKRRLTSQGFLQAYKKILAPGGQIHMKTDNLPLLDFSLEQLISAGFEITEETRHLHKDGPEEIMTDYEVKFYEQAVPINKCIARISTY